MSKRCPPSVRRDRPSIARLAMSSASFSSCLIAIIIEMPTFGSESGPSRRMRSPLWAFQAST